MTVQLLVIAKQPAPGRVKTRLCPPCTPDDAARIAGAALADTIDAVGATRAGHRTLVVDGAYPVPPGWATVPQRGSGLGNRLAYAFADSHRPGVPSLLIGMDTPQVTPAMLESAATTLGTPDGPDGVLGPAADGGWWALGLRNPAFAEVLRAVPMSTVETGRLTLEALHRAGLRITLLPVLRDVDTAPDALAVAGLCPPASRFAAAVCRLVPAVPRTDALALFDRALTRAAAGRRALLTLRDDRGGEHRIDPAPWCRPHLPGDARLLARCGGPTLDVGCGPGRLTRALTRLGCPALGIDVSAAAVRLARHGGAAALRRDVFGPLPGHGRWRNVLLADGNIGIGGDPSALLRRCRELLARDGRLHVELAAPGGRSWAGDAVLSAGGGAAPLRWAVVAAGDLDGYARTAALRTLSTWTEAGRWFTTLSHP